MQKRRTPIECLEFMRAIAQQNGAKLLDTEWNGKKHSYQFKLNNGEIISRKYDHIATSGWHKSKDFTKKSTALLKTDTELLNELRVIAENNSGKLLETEWKGSKHKYCFENHLGNKFYRTASNVRNFPWPIKWNNYFNNKNISSTTTLRKTPSELLNELQTLAIKNQGTCLETIWLGTDKPHLFEDEFGSHFYCTPKNLKNGYWGNKRGIVAEPICRQVLEHLFNNKFPSNRSVLNSKLLSIKRNLELDGYCKDLNIAFEYQGYPSHWDTNHKKYIEVHQRDLLKKEWCEKLGILLLEIPVFPSEELKWKSELALNYILNIVKKKFKENNKPLPKLNTKNFIIQFNSINHGIQQLKILKEISLKHNGKLISKTFVSSRHSYLFEDENGNQFNMTIKNYTKNGWPNNISAYNNHQLGHKKDNKTLLNELEIIANQNNAKLLDRDWNGIKFKYSFLLSNGQVIKKTAQAVKKYGLSIKPFFDKDEAFKYIKNLATLNNAKLLDPEWKGSTTSYSFNLNNEILLISYTSLFKNGWPKDLNKFKKYSAILQKNANDFYQELVDFATKHNGKVLTPNWLGNKTLHQFITEDGIIFEKKPINIKRSGWHK